MIYLLRKIGSKRYTIFILKKNRAIPRSWKNELSHDEGRCRNLLLLNHHLIKNNQLYLVEKLNSRELYLFSIYFKNTKPSSQVYFENYFRNDQLMWNDIYVLPRTVTIDSRLRCFQYKILHNVLHLNEKLFLFKKTDSKLCPFCKSFNETVIHIFAKCVVTARLWSNIKEFFKDSLTFPSISPQSAIFGFFEVDHGNFYILNHILLLYKQFIYISRDLNQLSFSKFARNLQKVYIIEKKISLQSEKKRKIFERKWQKILVQLETL